MKRALIITVLLLGAAGGASWLYLFHTESGMRFVLNRLTALKSVQIVIDDAHGHLAGPLTIKHVLVEHKLVHVEADDVVLDPSPSALFLQTLQLESVTASRARVDLKKNDEESNSAPRFFLGFLRLVVNSLDVHDARVTSGDTFTQSADRVRGRLRLNARSLQVDGIEVEAPGYSAKGSVGVRALRPIPLQVEASFLLPAPRGPKLEARVTLSGPLPKMRLDAALIAPSKAELHGEITRGANRWQLLGDSSSEEFSLAPWLQNPPFSLHNLALRVDASPDGIHLVGRVTAPEVDALPLSLDLQGQYSNRVIAITRGQVRPTRSDMSVITAARIDLSAGRPVIAATAQWANLRWPIRENFFVSPRGQASLAGSLPFDVGIDAEVRTVRNIAGHALAHGALSDAAIDFDELKLQALNGEVTGAARLNFSQAHEWRANLEGRRMDPRAVSFELPGSIDFKVDAAGAGLDRRAAFAINLSSLRGTLRGERLDGRGFLAHDAGGWNAKELLVTLGQARVAANGEWRRKIDVAWSVEIPALEKFLAGAKGSLRFQGTGHGNQERPQLAGSLSAQRLSYQGWTAAEFSLAGNVDLSDQLASRLELDAKAVGWQSLKFDSVHARGEGKATAHSLELRATTSKNGAVSEISTALTGAYANNRWRGQVEPVALRDRDGVAPTATANAGHAEWSSAASSLDNLCVLWSEHRLCATGAWSSANNWRLEVDSDALPLSIFNDTFPEKSRYQGTWQVNARLGSGNANAPWTGTANVAVDNASLTYQPIAGAEEIVKLGTGRVDVTVSNESYLGKARIVTPGTTSIDASARIARVASVEFMKSALTGELHAATGDANLLPLFFPSLDHSAGELSAQLRVTGTPAEPLIDGTIDLQKGELDLYRYNLSVRELGVTARIADNRLSFNGQSKLGTGQLAMNGELYWRNLEPVGRLHMQGENLLVANLPEYRVTASPNLDFQIDGKRVDVRGQLAIPSAHIEPRDLRRAVQASPDAHLVGELIEPPLGGYQLHSEVRVNIGSDVQLDTYGLQGKLGGAVNITTENTISTGRGELNVVDGRYEAYGQKLEISRGRLLFDTSPLDNPGLDIQAARRIEETRVGVNVRGTLRAPRVTLFSEPGLPQSQIVSMLLTGKPIADLSNRDAATVGAAQPDLRVQGGGILASQIGRRLGLEEVGVESTGTNNTSLVIGKFLSPRLFVSYGISLTESINTLKLRYTISDRWLIRTEAGQNQSADVQYRFER